MTETVCLYTKNDRITFGEAGFTLTELDVGPAVLLAGTDPLRTAGRRVTVSGVLLPEGESYLTLLSRLEPMRRRLCRITGATEGFTLSLGDKTLPLLAEGTPHFGTKPPFSGPEALSFTLSARAKDEASAFFTSAEECLALGRGWTGQLIFPLSLTGETLFGVSRPFGTVTVTNPGDVPVGFSARLSAETASVSDVTLSLPTGERMTLLTTLAPGESVTVDTRPGQKSVTGEKGENLLSALSEDSTFFSLAPGENVLSFAHGGAGTLTLSVALSPRYFS